MSPGTTILPGRGLIELQIGETRIEPAPRDEFGMAAFSYHTA